MIQETLYYYKPEPARLVTIPGTWPEAVREAQTALLASQGYGRVVNYEQPRSQMPFALVIVNYEANADGTYTQNIATQPLPVLLSQDKLLRHPRIQARLDDLMAIISGDAALADWWLNDTRYVRGSEMAVRAMQLFGFTQDEAEEIVLACRA